MVNGFNVDFFLFIKITNKMNNNEMQLDVRAE